MQSQSQADVQTNPEVAGSNPALASCGRVAQSDRARGCHPTDSQSEHSKLNLNRQGAKSTERESHPLNASSNLASPSYGGVVQR